MQPHRLVDWQEKGHTQSVVRPRRESRFGHRINIDEPRAEMILPILEQLMAV